MSSPFANPAGGAAAGATTYTLLLFELLGDRDPIAVQMELLSSLCHLTEDLSPEELHRPEGPGKWSVAQVIDHLVDQELVNSYRTRSVVAEERPTLLGYDQDRWAARLRYGVPEAGILLDELQVLRVRNLRLLRDLAQEEMTRVGNHTERGPESIFHMMKLAAAHDLVHRRQIERIRTSLGKPERNGA
jgi:hypothetical protein